MYGNQYGPRPVGTAAAMGGGAMYGGGGGAMAARGPNGNCCAAGAGEEVAACGVSCGGNGQGAMSYVGGGQGEYIQETTYQYVGCGGDYDTMRPRRNFTCLITTCCLLSLLLLIPLLSAEAQS